MSKTITLQMPIRRKRFAEIYGVDCRIINQWLEAIGVLHQRTLTYGQQKALIEYAGGLPPKYLLPGEQLSFEG